MTAFYNKPWAPGYALPAYEREENALTRGSARTTKWLPRGTISKVPPGYSHGGYAVPAYVLKEPVGSQAFTTPWIPRGTVMSMKGIKTGLPWKPSAHSLDSNGLGALGSTNRPGASVGTADPIENYGKRASAVVMEELKNTPKGQQDKMLRELLGEIDPGLYRFFKREMKQLKDHGASPEVATQHGLAIAFTHGLTKEFIAIGKKRKPPTPARGKGHVALAALTGFDAQANNYYDLGGITSSVKNAVSKIGGFACDVATNPLTPIAAGAAGAGFGGAAGATSATTGAAIAATACGAGAGTGFTGAPPAGGIPSWAIPVAIGGGALLLVMALKK